jgi:hypothetical protein
LLQRPAGAQDDQGLGEWFTRLAGRLLHGSRLVVARQPHRFAEVEIYYCGEGHADTFTHRDPLQREQGRWYFHRTAGVYRSGSFKGFDLTFGDGQAFAGVLIRGLDRPDGTRIDGPSLCVDHLLDATGAATVAELDRAVGGRAAWDASNPLFLQEAPDAERQPVLRTARVGLSLKRAKRTSDAPRYILRRYRYLAGPRKPAKGKPHMVLALHADGQDAEAIRGLTGCPRAAVQRYVEDYEAGKQTTDFGPYFGKDLTPKDLCSLHGTWFAVYGNTEAQPRRGGSK